VIALPLRYHFHERLSCLYDTSSTTHSTRVGATPHGKPIYGKWESQATLPALDACGAHFGVTPDSNGASTYHYHVQVTQPPPSRAAAPARGTPHPSPARPCLFFQDRAPFTVACYGPDYSSQGTEIHVSPARCMSLYPECSSTDTANSITVTTARGAENSLGAPW
jgi:hypothetical protein